MAVLMRGTVIRFRPSALSSLLTGKAIFLTFTTDLFVCIMLCFYTEVFFP